MVVEATQTGELIVVKNDKMMVENDVVTNDHNVVKNDQNLLRNDHIVVKSGSVYGKDVVDYFRDAVNILIFNRLDRIECKEWKVGPIFCSFFVSACFGPFPNFLHLNVSSIFFD